MSPSTTPSTVGRDSPVTRVISVSVAQSVARSACSTTAELILRSSEGSPPVSRPNVRPPSSCACWPDRTRRGGPGECRRPRASGPADRIRPVGHPGPARPPVGHRPADAFRSAGRHEPRLVRRDHRLRTIPRPQLRQYRADVRLHRLRPDDQAAGCSLGQAVLGRSPHRWLLIFAVAPRVRGWWRPPGRDRRDGVRRVGAAVRPAWGTGALPSPAVCPARLADGSRPVPRTPDGVPIVGAGRFTGRMSICTAPRGDRPAVLPAVPGRARSVGRSATVARATTSPSYARARCADGDGRPAGGGRRAVRGRPRDARRSGSRERWGARRSSSACGRRPSRGPPRRGRTRAPWDGLSPRSASVHLWRVDGRWVAVGVSQCRGTAFRLVALITEMTHREARRDGRPRHPTPPSGLWAAARSRPNSSAIVCAVQWALSPLGLGSAQIARGRRSSVPAGRSAAFRSPKAVRYAVTPTTASHAGAAVPPWRSAGARPRGTPRRSARRRAPSPGPRRW